MSASHALTTRHYNETPIVTLFSGIANVLPVEARELANLEDLREALGESRELPVEPHYPSPELTSAKRQLPMFSMASFKPWIGRKREGVEAVHGFVADLDDGSVDLERWLSVVPFQALGYSSPGHTPERPKSRIVIPFNSPIRPEDYRSVFAWFQQEVFDGHLDESTKDPSRGYFLPAHMRGVVPLMLLNSDEPVCDAQEILAAWRIPAGC